MVIIGTDSCLNLNAVNPTLECPLKLGILLAVATWEDGRAYRRVSLSR